MSRKLTKGYFVKGKFVAEGSELDIELKKELKGTDAMSRTDEKRESLALQKLGEDLLTLRPDFMARLDLSEKLKDAVVEAKRITNFVGKRRQMQFIGKQMRLLEPQEVESIKTVLHEQLSGSASDIAALHQAQTWRDRLIAEDGVFSEWIEKFPQTDAQQLRALVRQARKDAKPELPGQALRHGRAFRDIFQLVRAALSPENLLPDDPANEETYKP
jgi:ribosome-associated protein